MDYFNNLSNNFIQPQLAQCPTADSNGSFFEFIPKRSLGIASGNDILDSIDFTGFSQAVTGWSKERKLLQPGEVIFIQGMTKEPTYRTEIFPFPPTITDMYNMYVDISINYYKNFKYITTEVSANGDVNLGITIANALNIKFNSQNININAATDAENFTFTGTTLGYDFNIVNDIFDITINSVTTSLYADVSQGTSYANYPNSAMLGYVLRVEYPVSITDPAIMYVDINHVPNTLTYYEKDPNTSEYIQYTKKVDVGNNYSSGTVISSGDYLNYITVNELWEDVGQLRVWLGAEGNLIPGFYVFNPQNYPVQIEYMILQ